jgi:cytidylate kinase
MPVVALTQEMGSLAKDVAMQLAEELKLDTTRHEVVEHVASRMRISHSLINRLREGKAGAIERLKADSHSIAVYTAEEVLAAAAKGNVVLRGWGATCLLRTVPHVLCVRITRPIAQRIDWLMVKLDTTDRDFAEDEIRRSDRAHAARMHEQFGVTWGDPLLYDLVLNTDRLSVASCVQQIRSLLGRPEFAETTASRELLQGLALQARVRSALKANEATREVNVTIDSHAAQVTLSGIVVSADERNAAGAVAGAVPGVASVDNQLRVMSSSRLFTSSKTT